MHLMALKNKVLQNRGIHFEFPYGIQYPRPGDSKPWMSKLPKHGLYYGMTARGFFYADQQTKTTIFGLRDDRGLIYNMLVAEIEETRLKNYVFEFFGLGHTNTPVTITIPGYYSVAVRIDNHEKLSMLYEEDVMGFYDKFSYTLDIVWHLRIIGSVHYLLSLHVSDESLDKANFPKTNLGQEYFLHPPILGMGSTCVLFCIVKDMDKPLEVHMRMDNFGKQWAKVEFPLTNAQDYEFTLYIRSSVGCWLVSTDFHDQTKRIDKPKGNVDWSLPWISKNCEIATIHCTQGAEQINEWGY